MIGTGSKLLVAPETDWVAIEELSAGDELFDLLLGRPCYVEDLRGRTIDVENPEGYSDPLLELSGSSDGFEGKSLVASDLRLVFPFGTDNRAAALNCSPVSAIPARRGYVFMYQLYFSRNVLLNVNGTICAFGPTGSQEVTAEFYGGRFEGAYSCRAGELSQEFLGNAVPARAAS